MKYTKEQIKKHREVLLAYVDGEEIQRYDEDLKDWKDDLLPFFNLEDKYRVKPFILFKNEIDEEFTKKDIENNITVYSFNISKIKGSDSIKLDICQIDGLESQYYKTCEIDGDAYTSISKSIKGAVEILNKFYNG